MLKILANPLDLLKSIGFGGILAFWHSRLLRLRATSELYGFQPPTARLGAPFIEFYMKMEQNRPF